MRQILTAFFVLLTLHGFSQSLTPKVVKNDSSILIYTNIKDTSCTCCVDTLPTSVKKDTVYKHDTLVKIVSVPYPVHDTIVKHDTLVKIVPIPYPVHDTLIKHDTLVKNIPVPYAVHDTFTVVKTDTFYTPLPYPVHDTIYGIGSKVSTKTVYTFYLTNPNIKHGVLGKDYMYFTRQNIIDCIGYKYK
jgi:hypothetical protein